MNLTLLIAAAAMIACATSPTEAQEDIKLETPDNWRTESVTLPPPFAKKVSIKGRAQVHFSPGWGDKKSEQFFTYAFVFETEAESKFDQSVINKELLAYYGGLANAVSRGKIDPESFKLDVDETKFDSADAAKTKRFSGTLEWTEPFFTRKAQKLNLEIETFYNKKEDKNYLMVCASPQDPKDKNETASKIWKQLRKIRDDFSSNQLGKKREK